MPQEITLSDETFAKLQKLARPLIDTTESVISRLADEELRRRPPDEDCPPSHTENRRSALILNPDSPLSLRHTRVLSASVDEMPLFRPKWNGILDHLHILARKRLESFEAVRAVSRANIREGEYEENGYRYLPEAGFSIQGVDSNDGWNYSLFIARKLGVSVRVAFEWREKDGAARPGQRATLEWAPGQ